MLQTTAHVPRAAKPIILQRADEAHCVEACVSLLHLATNSKSSLAIPQSPVPSPELPPMKPRILVVGDLILDIYLHGSVERVNPEAPGIVFNPERMEERLGGAGAVAMLCASLGAETTLVAPGTSHSPAEKLLTAVGVEWWHDRPLSRLSARQRHVCDGRLLHDRIDVDEVSTEPVDSHLPVGAPRVHAILVADYGRGAVGPDTLAALRRLHSKVPIIVDPARGVAWKRYAGATIIKCNAAEARAASTATDLGVAHLIVTDGANGMTLDGDAIPTERTTVVDVTGAGDTVLAVLGVCLAQGIELQNACRFGNRAAGLQVGRLGVQPITWDQILQVNAAVRKDDFAEWVGEFRQHWMGGAA